MPPDIGGSIGKIGKATTIADLGIATAQAVVVYNDLSAPVQETKGHVRGAPLSAKTHELEIKTWNTGSPPNLNIGECAGACPKEIPIDVISQLNWDLHAAMRHGH